MIWITLPWRYKWILELSCLDRAKIKDLGISYDPSSFAASATLLQEPLEELRILLGVAQGRLKLRV